MYSTGTAAFITDAVGVDLISYIRDKVLFHFLLFDWVNYYLFKWLPSYFMLL